MRFRIPLFLCMAPLLIAAPSRIIDTHIHIYDPSRPEGVPWPPSRQSDLYRTVLPADHAALAKPVGVTGAVIVECSDWLEDNQWVLDKIRDLPDYNGLVGNLRLGVPAFAANLERFSKEKKFLGIRLRTQSLDPDNLSPEVLRDLRALAAKGLVLDINYSNNGPGVNLDMAAAIAKQVPELPIMLDHLSGARVDGQAPSASVQAAFQAVAKYPHVYIKVSGLVNQSVRQPASLEAAYYAPLLNFLAATFGTDRLVYGSNWPVSDQGGGFAAQQAVVLSHFQALGDSVLENILWRNAARFYHLDGSLNLAGKPSQSRKTSDRDPSEETRRLDGRLAPKPRFPAPPQFRY